MTVFLALTLIVAAAAVWAWRRAERYLTAAEERADFYEARAREAERERERLAWRVRRQREVIQRYRRDFWELADLDGTPPAACAALTPDAEPPIPAGWLDDLDQLPTTYDREYPR